MQPLEESGRVIEKKKKIEMPLNLHIPSNHYPVSCS